MIGQMNTHGPTMIVRRKPGPLIWTRWLRLHQVVAGWVAKRRGKSMSKGCLYQVHSFFLLRNSKGIENSAQEASRDFRQEIVFAVNTGTIEISHLEMNLTSPFKWLDSIFSP